MVVVRCGVSLLVSLLVVQSTSLDAVLARAGDYILSFHREFPLLVAEESYVQNWREIGSTHDALFSGSAAPLGEVGERKVRKLRSQFVLEADRDQDTWWAFRDVFEVDGRALRAQKDRLERLFLDAPAAAVLDAATAMSMEGLGQNLGKLNRSVNAPTFALTPLLPGNQSGFAFTKTGERKVDGAPVWVLAYKETQRRTLVKTSDGTPQPIRGELWIDPANGRVVKTRVVYDTLDAYPDMKLHPERYAAFPLITIDVTYRLDARLNAWLPSEMKELYDRKSEILIGTATYSNYRRPGAK